MVYVYLIVAVAVILTAFILVACKSKREKGYTRSYPQLAEEELSIADDMDVDFIQRSAPQAKPSPIAASEKMKSELPKKKQAPSSSASQAKGSVLSSLDQMMDEIPVPQSYNPPPPAPPVAKKMAVPEAEEAFYEESFEKERAASSSEIPSPIINKSDLQVKGEQEGDLVNCTAYSPSAIKRGDSFMVKAFAHLQEQATIVDDLVRELNPELSKRAVKPLNLKVQVKQSIQFLLSIADWEIDEPNQTLTWWGEPNSVEYWVDVPEDYAANSVLAKLLVFVDGNPAGSLKFKIDLEREVVADIQPAKVEACHYRFAFISYASPDRDEVLRRAQMLQASKIDFFQDVLELEPGQRWEQELYRNIDKCDVFFLFWSNASKSSEWVRREWQYALDLQKRNPGQSPDIIPVAIEKPIPIPPAELSYLHFGNAILQILNGR